MFDLEILYRDRPPGAVEVTAAADAESIELWNTINGDSDRWIEPELVGGWTVALLPQARARRIRAELPALLKQLEQEGIREVRPRSAHPRPYKEAISSLGIAHIFQGGTDYPGSIYPTIDLPHEKSAGFVADTGDALADWLTGWTRQPEQSHNLQKLRNSGRNERHMFLILPGFADASFAVTDLLMRDRAPLPTIPPVLPEELTHAWSMSSWNSGDGMRWSPDLGWQRFDKQVEP